MDAVLEQQFDDVLSTPELEAPPVEPDAHRAKIESVSARTFESGTTGIEIILTSIDAAFEMNYMIFPPQEFVGDVTVDPSTLSEVPAEGKKQSARQRYAAVVSNTDKTAELQNLRAIAYEAGRKLDAGTPKPTTFEEFVELLNALLSGVDVVVTRRADNSSEDPAFRNRLKVSRIHSISVVDNPKALKKYRKAWEQQ